MPRSRGRAVRHGAVVRSCLAVLLVVVGLSAPGASPAAALAPEPATIAATPTATRAPGALAAPTTTPTTAATTAPTPTAPAPPPLPSPTPTPSLAAATRAPVTGLADPGAGPVLTDRVRRAMQARLDAIRTKYGIPGVSAAVIFPDGSTWLGTSGLADVDRSTPVTPDTAFALASVSKTFTGALVMGLIQDGRLQLDTRVATILPAFGLDPAITVRQLLDHTSGLRDYFFGRGIDAALLGEPARRWDVTDAMRYVGKPYFKPGQGWHYSNTNYLLLGAIAETVGKAPLADQLRARFFEPLGLTHTYYQPEEAPKGPIAHGYRSLSATSPQIDLTDGTAIVPFTSVVTAAAGAGGIASTAGDVARWARALYEGDALAEATVRTMVADVTATARFRPSRPYGLGVQAVPIFGRPALGHSGRFLGFRSVVRWLPEDHLTVAVLTDQSRVDPAIIARALVKVALTPTRLQANPAVR